MSYYDLRPPNPLSRPARFTDFDGQEHPVGEEWVLLRTSLLPYDDGLSIFVEDEPGQHRQIRMQWRDEAQGPVIDHLSDYLKAVV